VKLTIEPSQLSGEDRAAGVDILLDYLTNSMFDSLLASMKRDPDTWHVQRHFDFGAYVRNLLRAHNFTDRRSRTGNLDDVWVELVVAASHTYESVRRKFAKKKP